MPELVKAKIRDIPDFPKPGIIFKDISTVVKDAEAFKRTIDFFVDKLKDKNVDYIAAIESRGFIFGAPVAYKLDAGLVIIRKPGKLPAETVSMTYDLEYGTDKIEMHKDAIEPGKKVVLIDDLLATGGTSSAACKLIQQTGGNLIAVAFVVDLTFLNGREKLPKDVDIITMLEY